MHFSLFLHLIPLQLIVLTALSPFKEVKQPRRRLYLDGCPFGCFTQFLLSFYSVFDIRRVTADWKRRTWPKYSPSGRGEHFRPKKFNVRTLAA